MKSGIATGLLITIFSGAVANGLVSWKEIAVSTERIDSIEKSQETYDNKMHRLEDKINDIHWHLIGSKRGK